MEQSSAVAGMMQQMGTGTPLCGRPPAIGPKPTTFVLGPDYSVDVTPYEFVVHYRGADKTEGIGTIPGSLSLPVRYMPVDVTRPVATRRHFVQQFMWWQEPRDASTWMLGWILGEIVEGASTGHCQQDHGAASVARGGSSREAVPRSGRAAKASVVHGGDRLRGDGLRQGKEGGGHVPSPLKPAIPRARPPFYWQGLWSWMFPPAKLPPAL